MYQRVAKKQGSIRLVKESHLRLNSLRHEIKFIVVVADPTQHIK